jgi:hypothetical protein
MAITSINPGEGPVGGHTLVTIAGRNLPAAPIVYFGDRTTAVTTVVAGTFIVTEAPPGPAGWVDVRIVDRSTGDEATLVDGYLYRSDQQPPPATTVPATTTPASPTTIAVTSTTMVTGPSTSIPTTTATPPTVAPSPSVEEWRDSMLRTPEGLTLAPVPADSPIARIALDVWVGALCVEPVCPGWVLEQ